MIINIDSLPTIFSAHLDHRGEVRGQVKHHSLLILGHADTLYRLLDVGWETALQDLPEIADVAYHSVPIEQVCGEVLESEHQTL